MIELIPLHLIDDNPYQPRQRYDEERLIELAEDIRQKRPIRPETCGLIHVPLGRVWLQVQGEYQAWDPKRVQLPPGAPLIPALEQAQTQFRIQLALGHRRRTAFNYLKNHYGDDWAALPVDLLYLADFDMLSFAFSENDKRDDLSAIERARAIEQAVSMGFKAADLAEKWNLSESTISNLRRLLQLPEEVKKMVLDRQLDERHARELIPLVQIAHAPKEALKLARDAVKNDWAANTVATEVSRSLARYTTTIDAYLVDWNNWDGQHPETWPAGCAVTCKDCEHCARQKIRHLCTRSDQYKEKEALWRSRQLQLAQAETGLPVTDKNYHTLPPHAYLAARKKQCPRLALTYQSYAYGESVRVAELLPHVYYDCLDGYQCQCKRKSDNDETDPREAERRQWRDNQERQAAEIHQVTVKQIESYLRTTLKKLDSPRDLALLVCLAKRNDIHRPVQAGYDLDSLVEHFTGVICGSPETRVGLALLDRANIYQLCRINTPLDEVKARFQVLKDALTEARLLDLREPGWRAADNLKRCHDILAAHPGHPELRDELSILQGQIENFSQEKSVPPSPAAGEGPE